MKDTHKHAPSWRSCSPAPTHSETMLKRLLQLQILQKLCFSTDRIARFVILVQTTLKLLLAHFNLGADSPEKAD
jgi:hypothetical protein